MTFVPIIDEDEICADLSTPTNSSDFSEKKSRIFTKANRGSLTTSPFLLLRNDLSETTIAAASVDSIYFSYFLLYKYDIVEGFPSSSDETPSISSSGLPIT